ncbi:hypothetical protein [Pedobacter polysacchareus]|uniref:hypothetical protein n=1 Tax=Pedobacter polysacchareus TaxID=2861973 RepID=UPI001C98ECF9|nr:hypothetical protein [Pedobacter polysacchareus]
MKSNCDDVFPQSLVKNFGITAQPLRLQVSRGIGLLYHFIDYNGLGLTSNQLWFNSIKTVLSEDDG